VKKNKKYGLIDKNNQVIIPFQYDYSGSFSEGLAFAKKMENMDLLIKLARQ